jgi:hypothetical protein
MSCFIFVLLKKLIIPYYKRKRETGASFLHKSVDSDLGPVWFP